MSHEIEGNNAFFGGNEAAWHGLGVVIPEDVVTTEQALELAGLDWEVLKLPYVPKVVLPDGREVELASPERSYLNVRSTDLSILGNVGERYSVFQNREAFAFGDRLIGDTGAKWHTAGSLYKGKQSWMLMKLPQDVLIAGEESERIQPFICFKNSHDGSSAITMFTTFTRVVCKNTLAWALEGSSRVFKIRHKGNPQQYIGQAQEKLGIVYDLLAQMEREGNQLIREAFTVPQYEQMLRNILPAEPQEENYDEVRSFRRSLTKWENRFDLHLDYFRNSENLQNVTGTKWGALQAIIEIADHEMIQRSQVNDTRDTRFDRIITGQGIVQQAHDYLVAV